MNFEVLKRSHIKRNIIVALVIVFVLSAIILTFTRAKYRTTESIPLLNGTINYDLSDLNLIGVYIQNGEDYTPANEIPTSGYKFNGEESYCTINNERDNTITLSFDMTTQNLTVTPLTKKGTKCYLYFDEQLCPEGSIACNTIIAASKPQGQTTDWINNGQGVTYYYTGANPDNWVYFAGFYWRIIRINGDGSIRMIYQGTSANETGTGTQIQTSAFNSSSTNKTYVGLVYDGSSQHGSGQNSTIMNTLNTWYNNNLASYETDYIDTGTGFCSDRNMASGSNFNSSGTMFYAPYNRASSGSLQCHDDDILSQDNGKIPNPIGLLTSDEYVLAGKADSYLDVGINYWTMSPYVFDGNYASVFRVTYDGYLFDLDGWSVHYTSGVRPVINIRADVALSGSGTTSDPFKIVGAS